MGYWDRKQAKSPHWKGDDEGNIYDVVEIKSPEITTGENIDYAALDSLESDMTAVARATRDNVAGIAEDIKKQKKWARDLLSANYWFAVCFNNDAQKQEFLETLGFSGTDTFVYGKDFAKAVGVKIHEPDHNYSNERKLDKTLKSLAREIPE